VYLVQAVGMCVIVVDVLCGFQKAYDSVRRDLRLSELAQNGLDGPMSRAVAAMCSSVSLCVGQAGQHGVPQLPMSSRVTCCYQGSQAHQRVKARKLINGSKF
jgi:hypothetical protein